MTELYLYQIFHVCEGRPRLAAEHAAVLGRWAKELFGIGYNPDIRQLERRIAALAERENYPHTVSGFVRLCLLPDGTERLTPAGISLYKGYALRSLRPDAATVTYGIPAGDAPTSAREAAAQLARKQAELTGASAAVRCGCGVLFSADEAPLFAVRGKRVIASPAEPGVERDLTVRAVRAAGLEFAEEPILHSELNRFDELFRADHRGVTALAHCDGHPYMSLTAERVACAMEALFSARS